MLAATSWEQWEGGGRVTSTAGRVNEVMVGSEGGKVGTER